MTVSEFLAAIAEIERADPRYRLGGDGSRGTCDCIGLIIGACRRCGLRWPGIHGTNWTARNVTAGLSPIKGTGSLQVGDMVFKHRAPGQSRYALPARYASSPDRLDYYHVGVVRSVSPLRIVNCTTPGIRTDTALRNWTYHGRLTLIDDTPSQPTLRRGDRNDSVLRMQQLLIAAGYALPKYGADGSFGSETRAAVRQFQKDHGLKVDGIVGPATWAELLQ
ncbi:MAG: peptidoglycan-binding protein [Aristaeellaceae bacterium]